MKKIVSPKYRARCKNIPVKEVIQDGLYSPLHLGLTTPFRVKGTFKNISKGCELQSVYSLGVGLPFQTNSLKMLMKRIIGRIPHMRDIADDVITIVVRKK